MKKLMIAAVAAVAFGSAFAAADCGLDPVNPKSCKINSVYMWQFRGHTPVGQLATTVTPGTPAGSCGLGGGAPVTTSEAIRVPGALAIQGVTYICEGECTDFYGAAHLNRKDNVFYALAPFQSKITVEDLSFDVHNVIGLRGTQYEAAGTAKFKLTDAPKENFDLRFAGFGTFDQVSGRVTSLSGTFAGKTYAEGPKYISRTVCVPAAPWKCACQAVTTLDDATRDGVAFGNWALRLNAAAAVAYGNGILVPVPAWAK